MAGKNVSFKKGDVGQRARSVVAESIKESGSEVRNPFAVATAAVKRMKQGKRQALAARR